MRLSVFQCELKKVTLIFNLFVLLFFLQTSSHASTQPHLTLFDLEKTNSLQVTSLNVEIEILGQTAITKLEYEIANISANELTAKFQLALPKNAKVIGYALDIDDEMRQGVMVPKAKARHAFNTIQNRGIDPGIAEVVKGNQFQTEIYPVLAKKSRKISVEYIETLAINKNSFARYQLPLSDYADTVAMQVELTASGMPNPPEYHHKLRASKKRFFKRRGKRRYIDVVDSSKGVSDIDVSYQLGEKSNLKLAQAKDGKQYFSFNFLLSDEQFTSQDNPKHLAVYWDASASMSAHHKINSQALSTILESYHSELTKVSLVIFANELISQQEITCAKQCSKKVLEILNSSIYDGATQLNVINELSESINADKALIFSDAINTFGEWRKPKLVNTTPTYVLSNQGKLNRPMQQALSMSSFGYAIDVNSQKLIDIPQLLALKLPIIDLKFIEANNIGKQAESIQYHIDPQQLSLQVTGIAKSLNQQLELKVNNEYFTTIKFNELTLANNDIAKYDWAIMALNHLQTDLRRNRQHIVNFGMRHHIVTPFTSLIVLENLEQYAEFDITPPASLINSEGFKQRWQQARAWFEQPQFDADFSKLITAWQHREKNWLAQKPMTLGEALKALNEKQKPKKRSATTGNNGVSENDDLEIIEVEAFRGSLMQSMENRRAANMGEEDSINVEDIGAASDSNITNALSRITGVPRSSNNDAEGLSSSNEQQSKQTTKNVNIDVVKWQADAEYLTLLNSVKAAEINKTYQQLKVKFGKLPAFYMDIAHWLHERGRKKQAARVLSNIVELYPETPELMRMLAYNYLQLKHYANARMLLKPVLELLPFELASYRDMAHAWQLQAVANKDNEAFKQAADYYVQALNSYQQHTLPQALMVLHELNRLIAIADGAIVSSELGLPDSLLTQLSVELFISMQWSKDVTDIDLWITEPTGEKINYQRKRSVTGAIMPFDDTDGYGPEIYLNKYSLPGEYQLQAKLYSDQSTELLGPTTLSLSIYSHYGTEKEEVRTTILRLKDQKEMVDIGRFIVEP